MSLTGVALAPLPCLSVFLDLLLFGQSLCFLDSDSSALLLLSALLGLDPTAARPSRLICVQLLLMSELPFRLEQQGVCLLLAMHFTLPRLSFHSEPVSELVELLGCFFSLRFGERSVPYHRSRRIHQGLRCSVVCRRFSVLLLLQVLIGRFFQLPHALVPNNLLAHLLYHVLARRLLSHDVPAIHCDVVRSWAGTWEMRRAVAVEFPVYFVTAQLLTQSWQHVRMVSDD